jgi:hypothetical protein
MEHRASNGASRTWSTTSSLGRRGLLDWCAASRSTGRQRRPRPVMTPLASSARTRRIFFAPGAFTAPEVDRRSIGNARSSQCTRGIWPRPWADPRPTWMRRWPSAAWPSCRPTSLRTIGARPSVPSNRRPRARTPISVQRRSPAGRSDEVPDHEGAWLASHLVAKVCHLAAFQLADELQLDGPGVCGEQSASGAEQTGTRSISNSSSWPACSNACAAPAVRHVSARLALRAACPMSGVSRASRPR